MMLRDMLRHESLAKILLFSDRSVETLCDDLISAEHFVSFYDFIDYIEQTTFGIACDAQANFRVGHCLYDTETSTDRLAGTAHKA